MKTQIIFLISILLNLNTSAQKFQWAKSFYGTQNSQSGMSMVVDHSGNIYTTGYFNGTVDFDPSNSSFNLTSVSKADIFISKLDASGNFVWAQSMGGLKGDFGYSITLDKFSNIYITGLFNGTVDFDSDTGIYSLTSLGYPYDNFILKLDATGKFVWAKRIGGNNTWGCWSKIDSFGNICTTGSFEGTADFDPGPGTFNLGSAGSDDIFVSKLDPSGNFVWAKRMGGENNDIPSSIILDNSGNIYLTGYFKEISDFDPGPGTFNLTSSGGADIFISKLDSSGNFVWAKSMGGKSYDLSHAISIDISGNVYTTGLFDGISDFDPGKDTFKLISVFDETPFPGDMFISKLDRSGNFIWAKRIGGETPNGFDIGTSIAVDKEFNVYTTGCFGGNTDFDPGVKSFIVKKIGGFPYGDAFVLKLDSSGNFIWVQCMGGAGDDKGNSITLDANNDIYTTGYFSGIADFDPGKRIFNLISPDGSINNTFISKFASCGVILNNQPTDQLAFVNANTKFTMKSSDISSTFQWQENSGGGYINISNGGQYSGATNDTLTINGVELEQNNFLFRCILKVTNCSDTTNEVKLTVKTNGIGSLHIIKGSTVFPNPASNIISIQLSNTSIAIPFIITDQIGKEVIRGVLNNKENSIDVSTLTKGFYFIQVGELNKEKFKLLKQ